MHWCEGVKDLPKCEFQYLVEIQYSEKSKQNPSPACVQACERFCDITGELGYDGLNGTRKIGPSYAKSVICI